MAETGLSPASKAAFSRDMQLLMLSNQEQKQLVTDGLKAIKKAGVKNKTRQRKPDGTAWKPRQKAKNNAKGKPEKMLRKIYGKSRVDTQTLSGKLHFRNPIHKRIAEEHHFGLVPKRITGKRQTGETVTQQSRSVGMELAKEIVEAGVNRRINKIYAFKGKKRDEIEKDVLTWIKLRAKCKGRGLVNVNDIQRNLSNQEAGLLLSVIKKITGLKQQKGNTEKALPARPAIDLDHKRNSKIFEKIITEKLKK